MWCEQTRSWYIWDGKRWKGDSTLTIRQMAKGVVQEMLQKAGEEIGKAEGEDEVKRAKVKYKDTLKAKSERGLKAIIELAKSMNCQNGVVDLRTGKILPHNPDYKMTRIASGRYVPGCDFTLFGEFLDLITCEDKDLAGYFQQVCGMAAIGKVFNEGLCIFYGAGQNGKSSFLRAVSDALGDYFAGCQGPCLSSWLLQILSLAGRCMRKTAPGTRHIRLLWPQTSCQR